MNIDTLEEEVLNEVPEEYHKDIHYHFVRFQYENAMKYKKEEARNNLLTGGERVSKGRQRQ